MIIPFFQSYLKCLVVYFAFTVFTFLCLFLSYYQFFFLNPCVYTMLCLESYTIYKIGNFEIH